MLNILFIVKKSKVNGRGLCPLECRLTYRGKRKSFSTGIYINSECWNSKLQIVESNTDFENQFNTQITVLKQEVNKAYLYLQVQNISFDVDDIFMKYKGEGSATSKSLLAVYDIHNKQMEKLLGLEYSKSTLQKFKESKNHIFSFLRFQYKKNDFPLEDLSIKFLNDFDFYMKSEVRLKQITINKHIERLRKIIKLAIAEGFLDRDPFLMFKPKRYEIEVIYLDQEELAKLEKYTFSQSRLQRVADMFVFCCYTGLAYEEMRSLTRKNIVTGFDNRKWIDIYRKKTKKKLKIPLLRRAEHILKKYEANKEILPVISNQNFNSFLKEIAGVVGIEKNITHHTARKTFATTVLLYNDIPMEMVSELLGHSNIKITQGHYAKVVQKKVSKEMKRLNSKLR